MSYKHNLTGDRTEMTWRRQDAPSLEHDEVRDNENTCTDVFKFKKKFYY